METERLLSYASQRIDTSQIRNVFQLAAKLKNPINFSIGQPDFPVPKAVLESYKKALDEHKTAYTMTQGLPSLREAISEKWRQENNFSVEPENILVSTGVASLLFLAFQVLFNKGDRLLLVEPYFLIYQSLADFFELECVYVNENFSETELETLLQKESTGSIKAAIFSTPSNPTGKILSEKQLKALAFHAERLDFILLSDEIYEAYDYAGTFQSIAAIAPDRTITFNGFSKSHSMTGLRVGYAGTSKNLAPVIEKMSTIQQYSVVCCPHPAQYAAVTALNTSIETELKIMSKRKNLIKEKLKPLGLNPEMDGAFYVFLPVPGSGFEFCKAAAEKELLLVPGEIFTREKGFIRLSYAQPEETLNRGMEVFSTLYKALQ